jgi:hypothetical protein
MSATLEREYRRALRWYPKRWRTRNEDAVVGTLLDVAEDRGESSPSKGDLRDLRARGFQERMGWVGRMLTETIRNRLSLIALATGVAIATWGVVFSILNAAMEDNLIGTGFLNLYTGATFGPFASLDVILFVLWIAAFGAALLGQSVLTRVLLVATLPAAVVAQFLSGALGMERHPNTAFTLLLCGLAILATLGRARRARRWRLSLGITAVVTTTALAWLLWRSATPGFHLYLALSYENHIFDSAQPFVGWICAIAGVIVLVSIASARWGWAAVTAISALPWLGLFIIPKLVGNSNSAGDLLFWFGIAIVLVGLAVAFSRRFGRIRITFTRL